ERGDTAGIFTPLHRRGAGGEAPPEVRAVALHLLAHPNIASRKWVYEQYDKTIGASTRTTNAPADAAVVQVRGTNKSIVITVDCNSRYVNADPEVGTAIAVAEAARNIVCAGGEPLAITNNLNFGNPYVPEVYWQFVGAIKGMTRACEKFMTPVTGGNVSFYNQSADGGPVHPTPTIGMLGLMEDPGNLMTLDFKADGDLIYLIGLSQNDIASSEYLYSYRGIKASPAPAFDIDEEAQVQNIVKQLIISKLIRSAHDVSDGGLFISLAESAMPRNFGFSIKTDHSLRKDAFLFGESQSRVVVSISPDQQGKLERLLLDNNASFELLGTVAAGGFVIDGEEVLSTAEAKDSYDNALGRIMN
ncbi:MAG: phosphoribosylformylglycinamidine synthase subunit PurL, partial [Cytophagaceae bacterium]|nr:phosphoribosylformylglycinamidine synthase subunit PurL [Cytophagaceae bacterium]